jgi:alginate O-acetyltransferase complex protein AlgI
MYKQNSYVWVIACIMLVAVSGSFDVGKFIAPLIVVSAFAFVNIKYQMRHVQYLLFFSISFASLLGFTETLTGSHAESSNILLYGLSFYTASMAY